MNPIQKKLRELAFESKGLIDDQHRAIMFEDILHEIFEKERPCNEKVIEIIDFYLEIARKKNRAA